MELSPVVRQEDPWRGEGENDIVNKYLSHGLGSLIGQGTRMEKREKWSVQIKRYCFPLEVKGYFKRSMVRVSRGWNGAG